MDKRVSKAWQQYYSYEAKATAGLLSSCGFLYQLKDFMRNEGLINPSKRLLDLGCGTGRFIGVVRLLAKEAVGADSNKECIELARQHYKSKNNRFICCDWRAVNLGNFDTVVANMSPFIRTKEDVSLMESYSINKCVLVTVRPGSTNTLTSKFLHKMPIVPNEGLILHESQIESLLIELGRDYSIYHFESCENIEIKRSDFFQREVLHMRALGVNSEESLRVLEETFPESEYGEILQGETVTLKSVFVWDSPKK